jgi:hypothetical protein
MHVTTLEMIEGVDLDAKVKCAGPGCSNDAAYLVGRWCAACGWTQPDHRESKTHPCCDPHWYAAMTSDAEALCVCGLVASKRLTFHIVEVLS